MAAGGLHGMETYEREDGKRAWRVKVGGDIVATDGGQGYNNEEDALDGLMGIFFGEWDESFLKLYEKWQSYKGSQYTIPPEAQEGAPVFVREGNAEAHEVKLDADKVTKGTAPKGEIDLGDDPDGDMAVDPRDT